VKKPVDRKNQMTKAERNKKVLKRMRKQIEKERQEVKKFNKDVHRLEELLKEEEELKQEQAQRRESVKKLREEEKKRQAEEGVIKKPARLGRFLYKQRKEEFLLEDELKPSLRQLKNQSDLAREQLDSVFRRSLVEPPKPVEEMKKRDKKARFKLHNRPGRMAEKLQKKREKKIKEQKPLFKEDVVLF